MDPQLIDLQDRLENVTILIDSVLEDLRVIEIIAHDGYASVALDANAARQKIIGADGDITSSQVRIKNYLIRMAERNED